MISRTVARRGAALLTRTVAVLGLLAGCETRDLTQGERWFGASVLGDSVRFEDVSVVRGAMVALVPTTVPVRPRDSCRERIRRPRSKPAAGVFGAFVIGDTIYFARDAWEGDFLGGYSDTLDLVAAMRLAHELTHVWQWQNRREVGYSPLFAMFEHVELDDPYLVEIDPARDFLDYGWEQQGVIVEEFVCCRSLDPDAPRTAELHRLISAVFPGAVLEEQVSPSAVDLPWRDAKREDVCR